jgi:hypothetical protein
MQGWINLSGGTLASLQDGTVIAAGNSNYGSLPISITDSPNAVPYWTYAPSFTPLNV